METNPSRKNQINFPKVWELLFISLGVGVILFFDTGLINKYNLPKTTWVYTVCLIAIPLLFWGWEKLLNPKKFFWVLLLITAGGNLLTAVFSMDSPLSFWGTYGRKDGIISFLAFIFLAFLSSTVPLRKNFVKSFLVLSIICGSLSALYGVGQFLGHDFLAGLTEGERIRPIGTIGGVNAAAGFLALLFPGIFALVLNAKKPLSLVFFFPFWGNIFSGVIT